jgi:hypothetical protein
VRKPQAAPLEARIAAVGPVLRQLLLYGFETFGKHSDIAAELKPDEPS